MPASKARKERRTQCHDTDANCTEGKGKNANPSRALRENPDVQVREIEGKGRRLVWAPVDGRTLSKGTTIVRLQPEVAVLDDKNIKKRCHGCFADKGKDDSPLLSCPGCRLVHYCSTACRGEEMAVHKMECKALSAFVKKGVMNAPPDPGFRARMVGRVIWQRMRLGQEWFKEIESLVAHEEDNVLPSELSTVLDYLCGSVEDSDLDMLSKLAKLGIASLEEVRVIFRRVRTNYLHVPTDASVAKALSSVTTALVHSCDPNVVYCFPRDTIMSDLPQTPEIKYFIQHADVKDPIHIVAVKDIKPGEELNTPCAMTFQPYLLRQAHLRVYAYIPECTCALCVKNKLAIEGKSSRVDPREALWCGRPDCTGWVALDWSEISKPKPQGLCSGCKQPCILNIDKVASVVKRGRDVWESVRIKEASTTNVSPSVKALIKDLTAIQPPCAYPVMGLLFYVSRALFREHLVLSTSGISQKSFLVECEGYRSSMLLMAGFMAGEEPVLYFGHRIRLQAFVVLLHMLKSLSERQDVTEVWQRAPPSQLLSRLPSVPPPSRELGVTMTKQALGELKCAYGDAAKKTFMYYTILAAITRWIRVLSMKSPNCPELNALSDSIDGLSVL